MELNLQPHAHVCRVTGRPFADDERVVSYLVKGRGEEVIRYDVLASEEQNFRPEEYVICRWVHVFKVRQAQENSERTLKLTAENLFLTLADPTSEPDERNTPLLQFLALMLERKRIVKPRGVTADGLRNKIEHSRSKQMYEIPVGDLTPEFFIRIQEQLSVLVGAPKPKADASVAATATVAPSGAPTGSGAA